MSMIGREFPFKDLRSVPTYFHHTYDDFSVCFFKKAMCLLLHQGRFGIWQKLIILQHELVICRVQMMWLFFLAFDIHDSYRKSFLFQKKLCINSDCRHGFQLLIEISVPLKGKSSNEE
ncbi:uncharacterized protein A4U43_C04F700 [Asparagus officinalis]|uniref:Uncharacterized protein n=1 Tax=Asparagus officinalis TaxID=4686 RepID=A0A5P1EX61_ASPOF|nr:uncharacterized protein A4U43_C04F700 [Asparagus officinalis]